MNFVFLAYSILGNLNEGKFQPSRLTLDTTSGRLTKQQNLFIIIIISGGDVYKRQVIKLLRATVIKIL